MGPCASFFCNGGLNLHIWKRGSKNASLLEACDMFLVKCWVLVRMTQRVVFKVQVSESCLTFSGWLFSCRGFTDLTWRNSREWWVAESSVNSEVRGILDRGQAYLAFRCSWSWVPAGTNIFLSKCLRRRDIPLQLSGFWFTGRLKPRTQTHGSSLLRGAGSHFKAEVLQGWKKTKVWFELRVPVPVRLAQAADKSERAQMTEQGPNNSSQVKFKSQLWVASYVTMGWSLNLLEPRFISFIKWSYFRKLREN